MSRPWRLATLAAGCAAALGLSACQQSTSAAQDTPPPKKDLGRSQVFYQGQEMLTKVDAATVTPGKSADSLTIQATGDVNGPGYTDATFVPRIYPAPPPDGVYEVDAVATKPAGAMVAQATPIEVKGSWTHYPQSHLKAVRIMAQGNQVTVPVTGVK